MAQLKIIEMTDADADLLEQLVKALRRPTASGGMSMRFVPGVGFAMTGGRGGGRVVAPGPSEPIAPLMGRFVVVAIKNDHLECEPLFALPEWNDGSEEGEEKSDPIEIAKVPELRHDAQFYPMLDSLTTVNAQEIDVIYADEDLDDETWVVNPPFTIGGSGKAATIIWAARERPGQAWRMLPDARAWMLKEEE